MPGLTPSVIPSAAALSAPGAVFLHCHGLPSRKGAKPRMQTFKLAMVRSAVASRRVNSSCSSCSSASLALRGARADATVLAQGLVLVLQGAIDDGEGCELALQLLDPAAV